MATKYQNPPVVYTTAKLIYAESIGSYGSDKYEQLLSDLKSLNFESYTISNLMGVQLNQADNQFTAIPTKAKRIGYFSSNRRRCAVIDEKTIELRLTEYDNHTRFLDDFKSLIEICTQHDIAKGNKLKEIELHYVDIFVPDGCKLEEMFSTSVTLPVAQFYSDEDDAIKIGATNFTRVLASGTEKISISLEQLIAPNSQMRKYLPDPLMEPDQKLAMPLDVTRLFPSPDHNEYAIIHTACGSLVNMEQKFEIESLRVIFENLYKESRKTFDHMISPDHCGDIWKVVSNK